MPPSFTTLADIRIAIDALDRVLISLLAERQRCIAAAARLKTSVDQARVGWRIEDVVVKVRNEAVEAGFDPDLAESIWRQMIESCIAFEESRLRPT